MLSAFSKFKKTEYDIPFGEKAELLDKVEFLDPSSQKSEKKPEEQKFFELKPEKSKTKPDVVEKKTQVNNIILSKKSMINFRFHKSIMKMVKPISS